jgi:uncharacterized protein (TIGR00730 family)
MPSKNPLKKVQLPWEKPKPRHEDPEAERLVRRLLQSPTYRMAEEDTEFLKGDDTRGVRLELDYLKAELAMRREGVEHTIVVFGSARIRERKTAIAHLKKIQKKLEKNPGNDSLLRELRIAERMVEASAYYDDARRFGKMVAMAGEGPKDNRLILMTGGGPGIMEAANRGAHDVGAKSIGLNIHLPHEQFPNPYISPELCFQFHYFGIRKLHFFQRAHALVAYPGGFGTLDELFEILTLIQTRKSPIMPVVMVGKDYWGRLIDFGWLVDEGMIAPEDLEIFRIVDSAEEAWEHIKEWHIRRKTHLYRLYRNGKRGKKGK